MEGWRGREELHEVLAEKFQGLFALEEALSLTCPERVSIY
jgi:hypothetical protein